MGGHLFVSGGVRSGKSDWAERLAANQGSPVIYLATASLQADDPVWLERIERHRARRPASWRVIECGAALVAAIEQAAAQQLLLIDSTGGWCRHFLDQEPPRWAEVTRHLERSCLGYRGRLLFVAEEVGQAVIPATAIGARFQDRLGGLNRRLAALCSAHWWVQAGTAVDLAQLGQPVAARPGVASAPPSCVPPPSPHACGRSVRA